MHLARDIRFDGGNGLDLVEEISENHPNLPTAVITAHGKIEDAVDEMRELRRGTVRLGTARTYARYFMPFLIKTFRKHIPFRIRMLIKNTER